LGAQLTLQEILTEAIADFDEHGYDSQERLDYWEARIREALADQMRNPERLREQMKEQLRAVFERLVNRGSILKDHNGVERFRLQNVAARLHSELERRILASAQLIKLNREEMINKTMRRFSGWASSVPKGGASDTDKRKLKEELSKPMASLPFVERRVLIDQGHKLNASLSQVLAADGGAIAAKWQSHFRQQNYNFREDHKELDFSISGNVYLMRDSWAVKNGLVKVGPEGWSDSIPQPAELPMCRCRWLWLYHLRQLPERLLTAKGKEAVKQSKARAA